VFEVGDGEFKLFCVTLRRGSLLDMLRDSELRGRRRDSGETDSVDCVCRPLYDDARPGRL
jgi:hypothetical protein